MKQQYIYTWKKIGDVITITTVAPSKWEAMVALDGKTFKHENPTQFALIDVVPYQTH